MASREPFSRHPRRGDRAGDGWDLARAADFAAATYGWGRDELDRLTDEQLVAYFDAAQERLDIAFRVEFERLVEAVRVGTIFAHDARQYTRWRSRGEARPARRERSLTGAALEAAVMRVAAIFPQNVVRA